MKFKIQSYWTQELGRWDDINNTFVNRKFTPTEEKTLLIIYEPIRQIIRFIGGPTGFESYYLSDIIKIINTPHKSDFFTICAGTINRWPNCKVKFNDFKKIIEEIHRNC